MDPMAQYGSWAASFVAVVIALASWIRRSGADSSEIHAMKVSQDQIWKALDDHRAESNRKHADIAGDLQAYRIKMAEEYVSKNDLRESEMRIINHINMVLSAVNCPYGKAQQAGGNDGRN